MILVKPEEDAERSEDVVDAIIAFIQYTMGLSLASP